MERIYWLLGIVCSSRLRTIFKGKSVFLSNFNSNFTCSISLWNIPQFKSIEVIFKAEPLKGQQDSAGFNSTEQVLLNNLTVILRRQNLVTTKSFFTAKVQTQSEKGGEKMYHRQNSLIITDTQCFLCSDFVKTLCLHSRVLILLKLK